MEKLEDLGKNFGEQMHVMGQIEALLRAELLLGAERQRLELELAKLKDKAAPTKSNRKD